MRDKIFRNFYFRNLLSITLILGGYILYLLPQFFSIDGVRGFCMFHSITGIPCPGCGMGKASILLSQGDLAGAFLMNPLAIPFAVTSIVAIIWFCSDLVRKKETLLPLLKKKLRWPYSIVLFFIVLLVWIWNILKQG